MINLQALEAAFSAVEEIGKGEVTFDVGGNAMTLRVMLPHEEMNVQTWAGEGLSEDDDSENPSGVLHFLDRFKLGTLSYAIIQIGEVDLRDVEFIPTGEKLANKKDVRIPRNEWVRLMVSKWSSTVRDSVFRKYGLLQEKVGSKAEAAIKFEPSDYESEIERLSGRIDELKAKSEADGKGGFAEQVRMINELEDDGEAAEAPAEATEQAAAPPAAPEQAAAPPPVDGPRQSSVPRQAAPPPKAQPAAAAPAAQQPAPQSDGSSIIGSENMEAAVEAENQRLLRERFQGQPDIQPSGSHIDAHRVARRRMPHDGAAEAQAAANPATEVSNVGRRAGAGDEVQGVQAFRMDDPPESLSVPPIPASTTEARINTVPEGNLNPRFRPPQP